MGQGRPTWSHHFDRSAIRDSNGSLEQVAVVTVSVGERPFDLPGDRWQGQITAFSSSAEQQALSFPLREVRGAEATKKRARRKKKNMYAHKAKKSRAKAKSKRRKKKGDEAESYMAWMGYTTAFDTVLLEYFEVPEEGEIVSGNVIQVVGAGELVLGDLEMNGDMLIAAVDTKSSELPTAFFAHLALEPEKRLAAPPRVIGFQAMNPGGVSTALLEIDPETGTVTRGTWIGGSGDEESRDLATSNGYTVVTGDTKSADFPTTDDAPQSANRGGESDIFITKVCWDDPAEEIVYSTLLGGSGRDDAFGVLTGPDGREVVVGFTTGPFPVTANGPQPNFGGGPYDTYITQQ